MLPVIVAVCFAVTFVLYQLALRRGPVYTLFALLIVYNVFHWHPRYSEDFPPALRELLAPEIPEAGWQHEYTLQFTDTVKAMRWAAEEIVEDARARGAQPRFNSHWPITVSLSHTGFGYSDVYIPSHTANDWSEVNPAEFPYVLLVEPLSRDFGGGWPEQWNVVNVGQRQRGAARAKLYYIESVE